MRKKIKIVVKHYIRDIYGYTGFDGDTKVFANSFGDTTLGITEFTGAIHGLMWIKKNGYYGDVLIESAYIKECIEKQRYHYTARGEKADEFLRKCRFWLSEQKSDINIELYPSADGTKTTNHEQTTQHI